MAIIKLDKALKVGDTIKFIKDDEEFEHTVDSMQVDHKEIKSAKKGDEVGIKVAQPIKPKTEVFK